MSEFLSIELEIDIEEDFKVRSVEDYWELWSWLKVAWVELSPMYPDRTVWTTYVVYET